MITLLQTEPLAGDPGHRSAPKANGRGLLLVCEHLHVGHPRGVINGDVNTVVGEASDWPCWRLPVMR
jgi:hypothetical protein